MKLLIYSHYFAPSVGGVEKITMSLASGLAEFRSEEDRAEFQVTVATRTLAGQSDDTELPFRVVRCPSTSALRRLVRESDLVHVAGPALPPMFWSWWLGKPFVIEHHGYQTICPNGLLLLRPSMTVCPGYFQLGRYGQCLKCNAADRGGIASASLLLGTFPRRWLSWRASANLAISSHVMRRHALSRSTTCYYGIEDPLDGAEGAGVSRTRTDKEKLCFAYVGRLVKEKGLRLLLDAAKRLQSEGFRFSVRFVGDGPERKELEDRIKILGLADAVEFTGFLRGTALLKCLDSVDAVVMPSIWEETAGLAAIEHMMLGRMVIAAEIGGLSEVVGSTALKFEPGDAVALAGCMREILRNPTLVSEFGASARSRALELFQRRRMLDDHARLYREIIQSERTGHV